MGQILDTKINGLGLEQRRESYYVYVPPDGLHDPEDNHIFAYADDYVEISNEFLNKLITFFEVNPELREKLHGDNY